MSAHVLSKEALSLEMGRLSYIEMLDGEYIGRDTVLLFSFMLFNIHVVAYSSFLENIQFFLAFDYALLTAPWMSYFHGI